MDRKEISRRILDFTLEIFSLLSGEDYILVKKTADGTPIIHESGGWSRTPITEPPPLIHEQKILEVTHKMIELLTGEVPIRCQDVAVYFSMEEWEYIEGQKDLFKEAMMEEPWPLTSQDSYSRRRNPPKRYPPPLYSQDCPKEKLPETHQVPVRCQDVAVYFSMEEWEYLEGHKEHYKESLMEDPLPLTSQENSSKNSEGNIMLSLDHKGEEEDIVQRSSGKDLITRNFHAGLHSTDLSNNPPNHEGPSPCKSQIVTLSSGQKGGKSFQCGDCGKQFTTSSNLYAHRRSHAREKPYSCSGYRKRFTGKSSRNKHERSHTGEKPYSCSECGKAFFSKMNLEVHQRSHIGEKSFTNSECGKGFFSKTNLEVHQRSHTGEKPFTSSECRKDFTQMSNLVTHEKIYTGEKPYSCSECGKGFFSKTNLEVHQRSHTGEKPFTSSECGKGFFSKTNLEVHQRSYAENTPFTSSECGKDFMQMSNLITHETIQAGEKPYSCSECGKGFFSKTNLMVHQRIHTG